jgi:FkbM family methyltransferase
MGIVSLLLADKLDHAILFEPNPLAARRAEKNLEINHLEFQVFAIALSDAVGAVEFENAGGTFSCNRTVDGFTTDLPTITVQRTTLDKFLEEHRKDVPFIAAVKIDVEGHENQVLIGMKDCLKNHRPKLIMFEYLARTDIRKTLAIFGEAGYVVFELSAAGQRRITDQVSPLQDLFACPKELAFDFGLYRTDNIVSTPSR